MARRRVRNTVSKVLLLSAYSKNLDFSLAFTAVKAKRQILNGWRDGAAPSCPNSRVSPVHKIFLHGHDQNEVSLLSASSETIWHGDGWSLKGVKCITLGCVGVRF